MFVDSKYRINIYLDTNILVDYAEKTYPLLNQSIDYLAQCPFVTLRSSHYVLFEYTEVRKYNLFLKHINTSKIAKLKNLFFCNQHKTINKAYLKNKSWCHNGLDYLKLKDSIIPIVQRELDFFRVSLDIDFDEHVLHKELVYPTNTLCLSTSISKEDCLVLISCMYPTSDNKLEQCILLSRDNQYHNACNTNQDEVNSILSVTGLASPNLISTRKIKYGNNRHFNLYETQDKTNVEFKDVWNSIIKTELRKKLSQDYIGETYCYGRQGTPEANCIYFDTQDKAKYIYQTEGLSFIPNDLSRIISINGPIEFWNQKPIDHYPYNNPKNTKYSFRPTDCSPLLIEVLRQKGNLVFYEK